MPKMSNEKQSQGESSNAKKRTRGPGKKTILKHSTMALDLQLTQLKQKSTTCENVRCKCTKSKCLKMYCECFTIGRFCDERCSCTECANLPENEDMIKKARKSIRTRNPQAFKPKIKNQGPVRLF